MIFATIGTQAPFDRFVRMLDEVCGNLKEEVVCQTIGSNYTPRNIKTIGFIPPDEFNGYFNKARLVVAHAGMGTILSALKGQKPLIVVPRLASLGEHRNDHQMATAMRMNELGYVYVAYDKAQLAQLLAQQLKPRTVIGDKASETLVASINDFIEKK